MFLLRALMLAIVVFLDSEGFLLVMEFRSETVYAVKWRLWTSWARSLLPNFDIARWDRFRHINLVHLQPCKLICFSDVQHFLLQKDFSLYWAFHSTTQNTAVLTEKNYQCSIAGHLWKIMSLTNWTKIVFRMGFQLSTSWDCEHLWFGRYQSNCSKTSTRH